MSSTLLPRNVAPQCFEVSFLYLDTTGMAMVYAVRFNEWLSSLWHGKRLAVTVAVLAMVIALACFWVANLMSLSCPENSDDDCKS